MQVRSRKLVRALTVVAALFVVPVFVSTLTAAPALAETSEKDAFEAAKELGTVDAWNAFLASYATGFHADLARAYLKKLEGETQAAPPQTPHPRRSTTFPWWPAPGAASCATGRGKSIARSNSLDEGDEVTLMARTEVMKDGYPWFKIGFGDDQQGYQWGGILCAVGAERPDVYKTCPEKQAKSSDSEDRAERKTGCGNGRVLVDGKCLKERAAVSYCGPGYRPQGGKCVPGYKAPSAGAPPTREQKKAVNKGCPRGQVWSAQEGCHEDD